MRKIFINITILFSFMMFSAAAAQELLIGPNVKKTPSPQEEHSYVSSIEQTATALVYPMPSNPTQISQQTAYPTAQPQYLTQMPTASSKRCVIKGNVSKRNNDQKIYHCPNWRDYDRTNVIESEGDRWFCTEAEAIAAGFRAPKNVYTPCIVP